MGNKCKELGGANMFSISTIKLLLCGIITIFILCSVGSLKLQNSTVDPVQPLEVKVYYEALCGDSQRFISETLNNAMIKNKLYKYADIQFVPFGKARIWQNSETGDEHIECQHGYQECELNAQHACIVENNNKIQQYKLIVCLMRGRELKSCSKKLNVDASAARQCKFSRPTVDVLRKYAKETETINLKFVPSIAVDGVFNSSEQNGLLYNFASEFCRKYKEKYNVELTECANKRI